MTSPAYDPDKVAKPITQGHCPDCNYRGFILGPRKGGGQNIECASLECRARFNVHTSAGWVVIAERIKRESEGGTYDREQSAHVTYFP